MRNVLQSVRIIINGSKRVKKTILKYYITLSTRETMLHHKITLVANQWTSYHVSERQLHMTEGISEVAVVQGGVTKHFKVLRIERGAVTIGIV